MTKRMSFTTGVWYAIASACTLACVAASVEPTRDVEERLMARRGSSVDPAVVAASASGEARLQPPATGYAPQLRLGYTAGDQWEPSIATDRFGHVYVLYPQYLGVPGCPSCPSPTMTLQVSSDRGATWGTPRQIAAPGTGQWDAQIVVDPIDGRTVYASWLQDSKSDTVVARSIDFGATWQVTVADHTNAGTDKPILVAHGADVYVVFNHSQKIYAASSHDFGATFTQSQINSNAKLGWALSGGGTITPNGHVHFGWAGYEQNGGAKGRVNLFVSSSTDFGATWTNRPLATSGAPPDCSALLCGWAYLGAQLVITSDSAGRLYALWNANSVDRAPNRIYFATSTDDALTWSAPVEMSTAPAGTPHGFPAIAAGDSGDVRIAWMDARAGGAWNTFVRRSTDGGASWSATSDVSTFVPGFSYIQSTGFTFPFGDYFEMTIDDVGATHLVWGEGLNYDGPGSIWYSRGQ
ncbi:MAG: sialidase family protein [Vicinamibacterales bacterium]